MSRVSAAAKNLLAASNGMAAINPSAADLLSNSLLFIFAFLCFHPIVAAKTTGWQSTAISSWSNPRIDDGSRSEEHAEPEETTVADFEANQSRNRPQLFPVCPAIPLTAAAPLRRAGAPQTALESCPYP